MRRNRFGVIAVAFSLMFTVVGCSHDEGSGLNKDQEKMANDVASWAKNSDGNWDKLTDEQKQTMIKNVGSEASAKKVLEMTAHPPAAIAPGPPPGVGGGQHPTSSTPPPGASR